LSKFQGHQKWFRPWIVMKGEKFRQLSTWAGNYNTSHLSYPSTDLIRLRPQTPINRYLLASIKRTNALSHPSQSYFLPYPPNTPKFPCEENCSPHISPTTADVWAKQRFQTQERGSSPTFIKLTRPYYHFPQSYSQVHW
jgi:hypothetical protein